MFGRRYFCPRLPSTRNSRVEMTGLVVGSTATYSCNSEDYYIAVGDKVRTCLKTGVWSGTQPRCNIRNKPTTAEIMNDDDITDYAV